MTSTAGKGKGKGKDFDKDFAIIITIVTVTSDSCPWHAQSFSLFFSYRFLPDPSSARGTRTTETTETTETTDPRSLQCSAGADRCSRGRPPNDVADLRIKSREDPTVASANEDRAAAAAALDAVSSLESAKHALITSPSGPA